MTTRIRLTTFLFALLMMLNTSMAATGGDGNTPVRFNNELWVCEVNTVPAVASVSEQYYFGADGRYYGRRLVSGGAYFITSFAGRYEYNSQTKQISLRCEQAVHRGTDEKPLSPEATPSVLNLVSLTDDAAVVATKRDEMTFTRIPYGDEIFAMMEVPNVLRIEEMELSQSDASDEREIDGPDRKELLNLLNAAKCRRHWDRDQAWEKAKSREAYTLTIACSSGPGLPAHHWMIEIRRTPKLRLLVKGWWYELDKPGQERLAALLKKYHQDPEEE